MAERTAGLYSFLSMPKIYNAVQRIFSGRSGRRDIVGRFIRPRPGDRILDICSGTSEILAFMPDVDYVGYEPNPKYVEYARERFADRGKFFAGYFNEQELARHAPFDIGVLTGVLHHLNSVEAARLLGLLRAAIKPGGRLMTLDNVFIENQNPIARKLIEWDRGKNVRTVEGYRALAAVHFRTVNGTIVHKKNAALHLVYHGVFIACIQRLQALRISRP